MPGALSRGMSPAPGGSCARDKDRRPRLYSPQPRDDVTDQISPIGVRNWVRRVERELVEKA